MRSSCSSGSPSERGELAHSVHGSELRESAHSVHSVIGVSTCSRLPRSELLQVAVPSATFLRSSYTWYVSVEARNSCRLVGAASLY